MTIQLKQLPPLSLYIHIPWCVRKCPYCDFNSHTVNKELPEALYVAALTKDLEQALPLIWGRTIRTIFIGGGTPSIFSPDAINQIITTVRNLTNLSPMAEITLEANPGTLDNDRLEGYAKHAQINRLSIGVQSFNDQHLQALGRIHNREQVMQAIKIAKQYFPQINLDLMYALPEQILEEVAADLETALACDVNHISYYNLTIEPNTEFAARPPQGMPDNDMCFGMQDKVITTLEKAGFTHYETSAYAKGNTQCLHNLNYWQFGDYLGIGAGAHSKLSFADKIIRQVRHKHPEKYMQSVISNEHIIENKIVTASELPFEFMLNSLRLTKGFPSALFVERTGLRLNTILEPLELAVEKELIRIDGPMIVPTIRGQDFLNDLLLLFL